MSEFNTFSHIEGEGHGVCLDFDNLSKVIMSQCCPYKGNLQSYTVSTKKGEKRGPTRRQ